MEERPFHKDIETVRRDVASMGRLAAKALEGGVAALASGDPEAAMVVLRLDDRLDGLDVELEARILDLIALHQPMARDLRALGGSLKVLTYLDRIGRYGYDIAVATLTALGDSPEGKAALAAPRGLLVMGEKATALTLLALDAYERNDARLAHAAIRGDDVVDELYDEVFRASLTYMMQDPRRIPVIAQHLLVARHLERAADNAVKVAEKAAYIATGERRRKPGQRPQASGSVGAEASPESMEKAPRGKEP